MTYSNTYHADIYPAAPDLTGLPLEAKQEARRAHRRAIKRIDDEIYHQLRRRDPLAAHNLVTGNAIMSAIFGGQDQ